MSGRNVNVTVENWEATGQNVPFPQYTVDVGLDWLDSAGERQERSQTITFPNVLQTVPLARLRRYMERIIMAELRIALGIDEELEG
jgi:hypothetical protein